MYKKKRIYSRHRKVRVKRDIQTLSMCGSPTLLNFGPQGTPAEDTGTCRNPVCVATAIAHGGGNWQASNLAGGPEGLSSESFRGTSVRGIQFDLTGSTSCAFWEPGVNESLATIVTHYMAIVKAEFDTTAWMAGGGIVPLWARVPNIIESDSTVILGAGQQPIFNREEDIFWRGMEQAISRNCLQCGLVVNTEGCPPLTPQFIGVVESLDSTGLMNMARSQNIRHVKLRTGRFLRPNEALFLVENWTSDFATAGLTHQITWTTNLYGTCTTRVAR